MHGFNRAGIHAHTLYEAEIPWIEANTRMSPLSVSQPKDSKTHRTGAALLCDYHMIKGLVMEGGLIVTLTLSVYHLTGRQTHRRTVAN